MKTLCLVDPDNSEIKYKISKFPDGQQDIVIMKLPLEYHNFGSFETNEFPEVLINSRFNSFLDLELIICATKALRNMGVKVISLWTPYILGARSDRKFQEGGTRYLKDVVAPIINSLGFDKVFVTDPHSDVMENIIDNLQVNSNVELVRWALNDICGGFHFEGHTIVSPDGGALKKIYKVIENVGYEEEPLICSKSRGVNGNLSKTVVPQRYEDADRDFIIIDDICDGGATFINIAEEIHSKLKDAKIYLIVTHGIFSKGFKKLSEHFEKVYCTNSIRDIGEAEGYTPSREKGYTLIKQYDVFK